MIFRRVLLRRGGIFNNAYLLLIIIKWLMPLKLFKPMSLFLQSINRMTKIINHFWISIIIQSTRVILHNTSSYFFFQTKITCLWASIETGWTWNWNYKKLSVNRDRINLRCKVGMAELSTLYWKNSMVKVTGKRKKNISPANYHHHHLHLSNRVGIDFFFV